MDFPEQIKQQSCMDCLSGQSLGFEIRMAFQPIIDWSVQDIIGYEALVRGPEGQGAGWVFEQINDSNKYYFDQACRVKAIETASKLGLKKLLSINFLPNAVYNPETCIRATIEAGDLFGFDITQFMLWLDQVGTPVCEVGTAYDPEAKTYSVTVNQSCPKVPQAPLQFPLRSLLPYALINNSLSP